MKKICLIVFSFIFLVIAKGQQFTPSQAYGNSFNRLALQISDTSYLKVNGIAIINNTMYICDGTKWTSPINVSGYVKYTDTASMLNPYLRTVSYTHLTLPTNREV